MFKPFGSVVVVVAAALHVACIGFARGDVTWISSTENQPWQKMPAQSLAPATPDPPAEVKIYPATTFQTIEGFGGCFNELGWQALTALPKAERDRVMQALYSDDGCAFNMARLPIGASDFGLGWYSLDDTPSDLALEHFSIARDAKCLIPFVKAAMAVRPELKCWGSAWSPPAWMKDNNQYNGGSLKWEPAVLKSYATYLCRWAEEYRKAGVNVFAVFTQNEPSVSSNYPSCTWTGPQLREFVADYLGPALRERKTGVELWLGTLADDNVNERSAAVLDDAKASAFITGVGYQYGGATQIIDASQTWPDKKFIQSETMCNDGANSWGQAQQLFGLMQHYLNHNASAYFAWNLVLDPSGLSSWKWSQNALITADPATGKAKLNGEYYVMRHFSQFIKPGAKRTMTAGPWGDKIGFLNPDGSVILVMGNSQPNAITVRLVLASAGGDRMINVALPGRSMNTFVFAKAG